MTTPPNPAKVVVEHSTSAAVADPIKSAPDYATLQDAADVHGLDIYGGFHPTHSQLTNIPGADSPDSSSRTGTYGTMILLGATASFWPNFTNSREYMDGAAHPIDRWSNRIIERMAQAWGACPAYPFTEPPFMPFVAWALATGRSFTSPSQMLVHDRYGMMISYRGALYFAHHIDLPPPPMAEAPCLSCIDQPCLSTCPAEALSHGGPYNLAACHSHLDSGSGTPCLSGGCLARRACPLSAGASRTPAQSAHHMRYFHTK
ncbi:ferredoxin [Phaeobacter sp. C3_T13_0]|uniref:ferredoxin n=1 Tax=Phaeobacter cretensis TaxID=3342641 RepID=UPI0039BC8735